MQEQLERELYERESMAQLDGLGADERTSDWEQVEREHNRELERRALLKKLAFVALVFYATYAAVRHVQTLFTAPQPPTSTPSTPPKKEGAEASAAPAPAAARSETTEGVD